MTDFLSFFLSSGLGLMNRLANAGIPQGLLVFYFEAIITRASVINVHRC